MSRLLGSNVLRLRLLHCLCYLKFSLDNKVSNPNAAAITLISKLTRIFTLKCLFLTFNILLESKKNISLCTDLIFTDH